ncbi:MAG: pilus assembly protein N-terminal domain-containing protein [Rhabdaerophilum sp.]
MMARTHAARRLPARWPVAAAFAAFALLAAPISTHAADPDLIAVQLDQAKLLKLPSGTETIIIGNPAIADVNVQRNGVLVITGRSPGRTNFIALDANGTIISESMVSVSAATGAGLVVQRGFDKTSYHCAPNCLPSIALGDEEKHFARSVEQPSRRDAFANQGSAAPRR